MAAVQPSKPRHPSPFHLPLAIHTPPPPPPATADPQFASSPPSQAATTTAAARPLPPSLRSAAADEQKIGANASSPASGGAVAGAKVGAASPLRGSLIQVRVLHPPVSRSGWIELEVPFRRGGCGRLLDWKETS